MCNIMLFLQNCNPLKLKLAYTTFHTKFKQGVRVFVRLYLENGYIDFHKTWHDYFFRPRRDNTRVKLRKMCPSPIPAEGVYRNPKTIEEWRLEQSSLFRGRNCRNEIRNHEKLSWVRFPVKLISLARLSTTDKRHPD